MAIDMPRKKPITIEQAKRMLESEEMQKKIDAIKRQAKEAGDEPEPDDGILLGPKDELANKRLDKQIERDMEESMEEDDF